MSGLPRAWRRSLQFRTVVSTVIVTILVVGIAEVVLVNRVSAGLLESKQRGALAEASAGRSIARAEIQAAQTSDTAAMLGEVADELRARAGKPPGYEVFLRPAPGSSDVEPDDGSTSFVPRSSIPMELTDQRPKGKQVAWAYGPIEYRDGRVEPGFIVEVPVAVKGVGEYQLFYLFPLTEINRGIGLVRSAAIAIGVILAVALGLLAWWYSRRLVGPVGQASRTAAALATGDFTRRLPVRGEDDMARLARSFNTMADSLVDQIGRLEALSAMQQRFVADVSHELRTPLTTIRMAAEVLAAVPGEATDPSRRATELLVSEVERFDGLLSDLLEISRFDAGVAVLELEETDLATLVTGVVDGVGQLAAQRDVGLRVDVRDSCLVACDPRRVGRAIRNLVVNAIEYAEGEPVIVTVDRTDSDASVAVKDHGCGIAEADLPHVFDRFWRSDPSRARTLGGTGLGLAISREDALLHGGDLRVRSELGVGSEFTLLLPLNGPQPRDESE